MSVLIAFLNRKWFSQTVLAVALLVAGRQETYAQAGTSTEYEFKAVFLFHFAQFVDWPSNAFSDPQAPLVIGILGDDPFGNYLDETVHGENVNGHPLIVQRCRNLDDAKNCQMLFISGSEQSQLGRIIGGLKGKTVLTVSDIDQFAENGGVIGFVNAGNKIHFKINTDAAHDANLTFSSKLLRLAEIVTPENK